MVCAGSDPKGHLVPTLWAGTVHHPGLLRATSSLALHHAGDGAATAPGNPCQGLPTLTGATSSSQPLQTYVPTV